MKIAVLVKQVADPNAVRLDARAGDIQSGTPQVPNEYDLYAVEAAIQLAAQQEGTEVVVASLGSSKESLNRCLAMGADRAVSIEDAALSQPDSLATAAAFAAWLTSEQFDVILVGQESSDSSTGNVGPAIGALLDLPVVSNLISLEFDGATFTLRREIEDGWQVVQVKPPVVLCALTGLAEPRYPSLKGIMAARRKPTETKSLGDFGLTPDDLPATVSWGSLFVEEEASEGVIVQTEDADAAVDQLIAFLKERKLV